jgi:anti-sigma factor RsiW
MTLEPILQADLHAYADGQLEPARTQEIAAYLASHPEDALHVAAWRDQNARILAALNPVLAEPVPQALTSVLVAPASPARRRLLVGASLLFALGTAAGLGVAKLGAFLGEAAPADLVAGLARSARDAHRVFAPEIRHPVEVGGAEQAHLLQWLSKRLGYPMVLPDLAAEGFSLVGGRLLSANQGPAALFMFENATGARMTLYCGKMPPVADTSFRYSEAEGLGTVYWTADDIGFALTGTASREVLFRIAELVFARMEDEPRKPS